MVHHHIHVTTGSVGSGAASIGLPSPTGSHRCQLHQQPKAVTTQLSHTSRPTPTPFLRLPQVFDAGSRSVLRQLKGHSRPVHVTRFAADKTHVLSGGDDVTLRWWDIASGKQLLRLVGHEDYVRAAAASTSSSDTWASGGSGGGEGGKRRE